MATLTLRNVPEETRRALKRRAAQHNRSMEAEARAILDAAVVPRNFIEDWLDTAEELRGDELELPERSVPRELDLS
ncbi:plasmid stabilization protein [Kribbella sp. NPDC059898]|uniref:FitA-like ribbon-helix-helix domain-containing protein n=1 Tax=Kribbella sp. NPDC059898 TaxID=3346995 RepID=UPI00365466F5